MARTNVLFIFVFVLLALFKPVPASAQKPPEPNRSYIESRLTKEGFSKPFIKAVLKTYENKGFEEVIRLNILLFLKKSDYHGIQVTDQAIREVTQFIEIHRKTLKNAEKTYQVPAHVIASLLWIESRHGKNVGNFHVPSVYLHLLQSPRQSVQDYLLTQTHRYTDEVTPQQKERILERTHSKSDWALVELKAIEKVYKWKWKIGRSFRGSFSGAFGMPQFLPSSYIRWSRSVAPPAQPNLSRAGDAIVSVAHYLKDHGWHPDQPDSQLTALMKYNNSRDYAEAILKLAEKTQERDNRSVASQKK